MLKKNAKCIDERERCIGSRVTLYLALELGYRRKTDPKYIVICQRHKVTIEETSVRRSRRFMNNPEFFCEKCSNILSGEIHH